MKRKTGKRRPPTRPLAATRKAARRIPDRVVNNLYEAKLNLSRLVDRAAAGEEIVIAKNGKPMARLGPLPPQPKRAPGGWEGKVWIADDFNDPLPDDLLDLFEGRDN